MAEKQAELNSSEPGKRRRKLRKSVESLREAMSDMEAGDTGRLLKEVAEEIRNRHEWTSDQ